jgi:hypothetical protein
MALCFTPLMLGWSYGPLNEELKAAKAAKAAIKALLTATPKSEVLATLKKANHAAILNLSSGGALNEARAYVGIALSNLVHDHGPPTPQSIDKAKRDKRCKLPPAASAS